MSKKLLTQAEEMLSNYIKKRNDRLRDRIYVTLYEIINTFGQKLPLVIDSSRSSYKDTITISVNSENKYVIEVYNTDKGTGEYRSPLILLGETDNYNILQSLDYYIDILYNKLEQKEVYALKHIVIDLKKYGK